MDLGVGQEARDPLLQISSGDLVMRIVVRGGTLRRHSDLIVPLVRVDDRGPNARVSVYSPDDQYVGLHRRQHVVECRSKERAVAVLDDHAIGALDIQFWKDLRSFRACYGDSRVFLSHREKGIAQIRLEFLPDPNNRLAILAKDANDVIDCAHQSAASTRQWFLEE